MRYTCRCSGIYSDATSGGDCTGKWCYNTGLCERCSAVLKIDYYNNYICIECRTNGSPYI